MAFIYADISNEDYFIKLNQCNKSKEKSAKWILRYENASFYVTEAEYQKIKKIHNELKQFENDVVSLKEIDKVLKIKKNKVFALRELIEKLKGDNPNLILKRAYIYSQVNNSGAFTREIEKLLYLPNIFKRQNSFSEKNVNIYKSLILKIYEKEKNTKLFNVFLIKEMDNLNREEQVFFERLITINIKNYYSEIGSPSYGKKYPDSWMKWAYNNLTPSLFLSHFSKIDLSVLPLSQMMIFEYYRGYKGRSIKPLLDRFKQLKESSKYFYQSIFFEIMNNEVLQRDLYSFKRSLIPTISQRRDFYKKSLESNQAINSNLYSLFLLGDIKYDYFIYALAVRTYGLSATRFLQIQ